MLELFEKHLDFNFDSNIFLKAELAKCKDVEEGLDLLVANGWALSPKVVIALREDASKSKDQLKKEADQAKEAQAKAKLVADAEKAKAQREAEAQKQAKINDKSFD